MALGIAVLPRLAKHPRLADFTVPRHIRDLGALLLTLVIFWAYLAFSQYLIIWYGNLPSEATWYLERFSGGWVWLILLVAVVQFILPFAVLLSLRAKRNLGLIAGLSAAILAARWLDDYWQVMPAFYPQGFHLHWPDLALPVAMGGLWIALFVRNLQRTPVPPLPQAGLQEVKNMAENKPLPEKSERDQKEQKASSPEGNIHPNVEASLLNARTVLLGRPDSWR